jgi:uncharacterized protein (DUF2267 family)
MQYQDFIGHVQHNARLGTEEQAVKITRCVLEVLAKRLTDEEAAHVAAQLPEEIGNYMTNVKGNERFDVDEFFKRVSEKEGVDMPAAVHHVRSVISVLTDAITQGEIEDVINQLPEEFVPLFTDGSEGQINLGS